MAWTKEDRDEATSHLLSLAEKHRVRLTWNQGRTTWQAYNGRRVTLPRPVSGLHYMIALHEIGHIASRVARRWDHRYQDEGCGGRVMVEGAAWAWAAEFAHPHLAAKVTNSMWARLGECFASHVSVSAVKPPRWSTLL